MKEKKEDFLVFFVERKERGVDRGRKYKNKNKTHQLLHDRELPAPVPLFEQGSQVGGTAVNTLQSHSSQNLIEICHGVDVQQFPDDHRDECDSAVGKFEDASSPPVTRMK